MPAYADKGSLIVRLYLHCRLRRNDTDLELPSLNLIGVLRVDLPSCNNQSPQFMTADLDLAVNNWDCAIPRKTKRLDIENIKELGPMSGPVDGMTTCESRMSLLRFLQQQTKKDVDLIAFTEMIRIGSLFIDAPRYEAEFWTDPNYLSGVPRLEYSYNEPYVVFQLAGAHNLPYAQKPYDIFDQSVEFNRVPTAFAAAAGIARWAGASAIDINMCCTPMHSQGGGTALLEPANHELAASIVAQVSSVCKTTIGECPELLLSAKLRFCQDKHMGAYKVEETQTQSLIQRLRRQGLNWMSIETRIPDDGQGSLNDNTARIKRPFLDGLTKDKQFPVVANGEILYPDDFDEVKQRGCANAMCCVGIRRNEFILMEHEAQEDNRQTEAVRSSIRGMNCANCWNRETCFPQTRCKSVADKIVSSQRRVQWPELSSETEKWDSKIGRNWLHDDYWKKIGAKIQNDNQRAHQAIKESKENKEER